jgi:hypothetical protein
VNSFINQNLYYYPHAAVSVDLRPDYLLLLTSTAASSTTGKALA